MVTVGGVELVREIASDQWGLVTRSQVRDAGVAPTTLERLIAPGAMLARVAFGVYRLRGAPIPDHLELRAAWLQLAPATYAWQRMPEQGVVSYRSAAALFGIGHLAADIHEFTVPSRRQTRRSDVRIHVRSPGNAVVVAHGLLVTRPARIAADLLAEREDPEAVAQVVVDALRAALDDPGTVADALAPYSQRFGFDRDDGSALLTWFGEIAAAPEVGRWAAAARAHRERAHRLARAHGGSQ